MKLLIATVLQLLLVAEFAYCFKHTLVTPKALRVGAQETAILNLHGYQGATVSYDLQDLPLKQSLFSQRQLELNEAQCDQPIELNLQVIPVNIGVFRNRQKVLLTVEVTNSGSDFTDTVELYVSKQSGYIFVVTDRPIYKPNDKVKIRAFPLKQSMAPSTQRVILTVQTPDGIGVQAEPRNLPPDDFIDLHFTIPETPELGVWSIKATYPDEGYETSSTTTFQVQRYVLPTFNVEIETRSYILKSQKFIVGEIKAEYSYGEKVSGNYFLSVKLKKTPNSYPIEIYREPSGSSYQAFIRNGVQKFNVSTNFIDLALKDDETIDSLFDSGASILLFATVTGSADGILETALTPDIPLVKSPYAIDSTRLNKYYIPTLSYGVQVDIKDANSGETKPFLPVVIQVGEGDNAAVYPTVTDVNGQINFLLDFTQAGNQRIEVTTASAEVENAIDQASEVFVIKPYTSSSQSYLQVSNAQPVVTKGQQIAFVFSFHPMPPPPEIRVLILARGSIVYSDVVIPIANNRQRTKHITATQEMIPSARLVAYYLKNDEIVSVSSYFEVVKACKQEVTVSVPSGDLLPGQRLQVNVTGSPNSIVSLVGVDRAAYFLYDKSRLTRATMFDKMASFDQGCSQQGGKDGPDVFLEAGLNLATNAIEPHEVNDLECPKQAERKKRNVEEVQIDIEGQVAACKQQGALEILNNDSCEKRRDRAKKLYDDDYPGCSDRFYEVCVKESAARLIRKFRQIQGKSGGERDAEQGMAESSIRSDFKESLFFSTVTLDHNGKGSLKSKARDSITTYDIDSAGMSNEADGFCVGEPTSIRSFKTIFIQLYVPYSLKKREQANLRLSVFNYDKDHDRLVSLEVDPGPDFCSYYKSGEWSEIAVLNVQKQKSASASVTVLPLDIPANGKATMKVRVKAQGGAVLDSMEREILIEEVGEIKDISESYVVDLKHDRRTQFDMHFSFQEHFVLGSRKCWIYAHSNFLGPAIEVDPITQEPQNIASIFRQPYGCGEQLMLTTGPNTYALMYQVNTKKIVEGTAAFNTQVARIQAGYNGEVAYRTNRHALKPWAVHPSYPPSTWLNAFVDKVFARAKLYYKAMDVTPVCNSLRWLLTQQQADGHFDEPRPPFHAEMHGAVGGDKTLAAYILISLQESRSLCLPDLNQLIQAAAERTVLYLEANKNDPTFHRPFAVALLTYALALHNPNSAFTAEMNARLLAMKSTSADNELVYWQARSVSDLAGTDIHNYWYRRKHSAVTVEASSYALLSQVELARFKHPVVQADLDFTRKVAKWLIKQRNDGGAFVSTQDTVIGLQALATYQSWVDNVEPPNINTDMTLTFRGGGGTEWGLGSEAVHQLDNANQNLKKKIDVPDDVMQSELISVTATGVGEGVLSYRCIYRTEVDEETCVFDLNVDISELPDKTEEDLLRIKITISVSKPVGNATGMAIVEVGLMSGFVPVTETLVRMSKQHAVDGLIDRFEVNQQSVILYLSEITAERENLVFYMEQIIPVSKPHPAKVNVYDYYEPSIRCGKFYSLPEELTQVRIACGENDDVCRCAEGGCPVCRTRDEQLTDSACIGSDSDYCPNCEGGNCRDMFDTACIRKFALVIRITQSVPRDSDSIFVEFQGEIMHSLKKGEDIGVQKSSNRTFVTRNDCSKRCIDPALVAAAEKSGKEANYFKEGSLLFVMGNIQEESRNGQQEWVEKYHLTETAVLERYIPKSKCDSNRNNYARYNCDNPAPRNRKRCLKHARFISACDSMASIVATLENECD